MNKIAPLVILTAIVGCTGPSRKTGSEVCQTNHEVHFSPKGGCTKVVVDLIDSAQSSVKIQAYSFTSEPIVSAIIRAHKNGKDVRVILDRSNKTDHYSKIEDLRAAGVPVFVDSKHPISHNKVTIVDESRVETGSFNYTVQAENGNAENCIVINDVGLARRYSQNWDEHLAHSEHLVCQLQ